MNTRREVPIRNSGPAISPRPVSAALAGIGFAAALLAPVPMALAAENGPAVFAREADRSAFPAGAPFGGAFLNDPSSVGIRSAASRPKVTSVLTVVNTTDVGGAAASGSLRQVLDFANLNGCYGNDYIINFAIPTSDANCTTGTCTIATNIGYSVDCGSTIIDGYSQAGALANTIASARNGTDAAPKIVIDGTGMTGGSLITFNSGAAGSQLRGTVLANWPASANAVATSDAVTIAGNFIGVAPDGITCTVSAGANKNGIQTIFGPSVIGGSSPADRNLIGCTTGPAIVLGGSSNLVQGNLIGVGRDGTSAAGNAVGVNPVASFQTVVDNVIGNNAGNGIGFGNFSGIVISGNDIFLNGLLGIDLGNDGPTANNLNTFPASLPNGGQNYPTITDVTYSASGTTISGTMQGFANSNTTVEFFDNDGSLGLDEGSRYAGSINVPIFTTPPVPFTTTLPGTIYHPSATATESSGTSEFSPAFLTPDMTPSTTSINFGTVPVGVSSAVQPLTIQNTGLAPLFLDTATLALGDYIDTTGGPPPNSNHWCGIGSDSAGAPLGGPSAIPINAGASCTLNLIFTPQNSGARNDTLTLSDPQSPNYSIAVGLVGSGSVTPPPVTWTFNPTSVLQNAPSQLTLTISNPNGANFDNPNFTYNFPANLVVAATPNATNPGGSCGGAFAPSPAAGATSFTVNGLSVPTSGSCSFAVDVTSATAGGYSVFMPAGGIVGNVLGAVVSNAASNTATLTVNLPAAPAVQLVPPSLGFGNVTVGSPSPPQTITLTNVGTAPLILSSAVSVSPGDYSQTNTCPVGGSGLPISGSCTIDVTFTPTAVGTRTADILIASNATPSSNLVPLTGNGVAAPTPIASLSASSLTFATQSVGTTSSPQVVTLTNAGTAALAISGIFSTGDFAQTNNCPASLAPALACQISVTFSPIISGSRVGDVKVFDNASGSPHTVLLSGTATSPPVPTVTAPAAVSFPPTQVGGLSTPIAITVGNSGLGNLVISAAQIVGAGYVVTADTCTGASIPTSGTCVVTVAFAPGAAGSIIATLRLISNAPASPTLIGLTGTGTAAAVGTLSATPASLDFGTQVIGVTGAARPIVVTNAGSGTVTVSGVSVTGDYAQTNNCATLAQGDACTISVTFTPALTGSRAGSVSIASNASNSPLSVPLAGSGSPIAAPVIELSVSSLTFGNRVIGSGSATQSFTLRNIGGAPLVIGSYALTGEFAQSNSCAATVGPGESCRVDVGFLPSIPGQRFGRLDVTSNASNGTQGVDLAGTGCRFTFLNRTQSLLCQ